MFGRGIAASLVLAFALAPAAFAEQRLMEVKVPTVALYHDLYSSYDFVEANQFNGDGSVSTDVVVDEDEAAALRAQGVQFIRTLEDDATTAARNAEAEQALAEQRLSASLAKDGAASGTIRLRGKAVVPTPGEVTLMRAYTFTNYAGRFLYVEAHTKLATNAAPQTSPTMSVSSAPAGGDFGNTGTMTIFRDNQSPFLVPPTPYMYHRFLQRVNGPDPKRVRVASSAGGTDEGAVTEWVGKALPPHVAGYQTGFFNDYTDPTLVDQRFAQRVNEFPDLAQQVELPYKTNGYRRKAQTVTGLIVNGAPYNGQAANFTGAAGNTAVIVESLAYGHEGGNLIGVQTRNPGVANSPLAVTVNGNDIIVDLATSATGALSSTAGQVVDAINASPAASQLVRAFRYRNAAGTNIAQAVPMIRLSDRLAAPPHVVRGPYTMKALRIGKARDGSKVGVFIYCQQHAREWVTPLTCWETAERLLKNYATDPQTKELVDNLDIFILPWLTPAASHYARSDFAAQRRNLVNHCAPGTFQDPLARNAWGVDLNRNNSVGSFFNGYDGADNNCTSDVYAGTGELSEPEIRNEHWIVDTFSNIKFAINIHTYGGYFMWAPGSYIANGRVTLPAPNIGIDRYFFDVADTILARIKEYRNTVIEPERTGPIADVLYSAAGNSADDMYYRKGIISYSFEAGSRSFAVNQQTGEITRTDVAGGGLAGFRPDYATEGRPEAMEFTDGNFGLMESALQYARDTAPPTVSIEYDTVDSAGAPINFRFNWPGEAAVIRYTTDGSAPTQASQTYESQGPRRPGQVLTISKAGATTVKWIATDIKGNTSAVQSQAFQIGRDVSGTVAAMLALSLGPAVSFGAFTPGAAREYEAGTTANVISTAGDAKLSVADPSTSGTGHLVNGAFSLPQTLQAKGSSVSGTGGAYAGVGGSANPTTLLTYGGPVSNDGVTLSFKQPIASTDPLRTGTYGKALTFTLSTTSP